MPLKDDLLAMRKLSRSRRNLEKIREQLGELRDAAGQAEGALNAVTATREALQSLIDELDADDNPLMPWSASLREAAENLLGIIPLMTVRKSGEIFSIPWRISRESWSKVYRAYLQIRTV